MNRRFAASYFANYEARRIRGVENGYAIDFDHGNICVSGLRPPASSDIVGKRLIDLEVGNESDVLVFSQGGTISIGHGYTVTHPSCGTVDPFASAENVLPPDPSAERVADGPVATETTENPSSRSKSLKAAPTASQEEHGA